MVAAQFSPIRFLVGSAFFAALSACDSGSSAPGRIELAEVSIEGAPRFAAGPVATACNIHNRGTANRQKCGCIQAAADLTLSQAQQQRSTRFFTEPELLQAVKLSDTPQNERFWYEWERFAETAERMCAQL